MSLSPFVCFQSRFVTYLLTFPRTFGHTDCYVLSTWRSPFLLYTTCVAASQCHFPLSENRSPQYHYLATKIDRPNPVRFLFMEVDEEWCVQKKSWNTRRTARSHNGCYRPHKGTSRGTTTSNTPCPHTSCKVRWCWR